MGDLNLTDAGKGTSVIAAAIRLHRIKILRVALVCLVPLLVITRSGWDAWPVMRITMETAGILLIVGGVLGRFWSILYSGGRKNRLVVTDGPYSVCRHPLYLFSLMCTVGFGLMLGSLVLTAVLTALVWSILMSTAGAEEERLVGRFGEAYRAYRREVPAILPRWRGFHSPETVCVAVDQLKTCGRDVLGFVGLIPLARIMSVPAEAGWFTPLVLY